jgi:hypothetical protein
MKLNEVLSKQFVAKGNEFPLDSNLDINRQYKNWQPDDDDDDDIDLNAPYDDDDFEFPLVPDDYEEEIIHAPETTFDYHRRMGKKIRSIIGYSETAYAIVLKLVSYKTGKIPMERIKNPLVKKVADILNDQSEYNRILIGNFYSSPPR